MRLHHIVSAYTRFGVVIINSIVTCIDISVVAT